MDQMQYNLLFRWFVGLGIDDPVWVPTVFTKNRDRLLNTEVAQAAGRGPGAQGGGAAAVG
jgi:transposase